MCFSQHLPQRDPENIFHTVHMHESRKEQQNNFQPTWAFLASPVPSLEVLSLEEGSQGKEAELAVEGSSRGTGQPWAGAMATASAEGPVPPTPSQGRKRCLAALISPSQSSPTSIQPTPYMSCGSRPKYPGAAQPFTTLIFSLFFQCFLVHTDYSTMKYNLYTTSILQLACHEAVLPTYLRKNVR